MQKLTKRLAFPVFSLALVAALGFGARQAVAAPTGECGQGGQTTCSSQATCTAYCYRLTGYEDSHVCHNGCCYCAF